LNPVSGSTRVAGLVGWPVRHSLSPTILNAGFEASGLDWTFLAFEVAPEHGHQVVEAVRVLGLGGLSVTMPHKAAAWAGVDARTPVAEALGAVNCVYWDDDRLVGDNTDGAGFVDALKLDHGVDPRGLRCVLVGAGGAGRAVARALGESGAAEVVVVNRSPERAEHAAALAGPAGRVGSPDDLAGAELIVNATPIGMGYVAGDNLPPPLPFDPTFIRSGQVITDLVYYPLVTPLLSEAESRGARPVTGLGMLVHQAAHAFRRWTGKNAPLPAMAAAALYELERRAQRGSAVTRLDGHPPGGAT
jgi:shikimate dehydrogenase